MSPFILGFSDLRAMKWNNVSVGIAVLVLALGENGPHRAGSVFNALLGGWLIASPFALSYTSPTPFWTNVILGIAIFITALVAATHRHVHVHPDRPPAR